MASVSPSPTKVRKRFVTRARWLRDDIAFRAELDNRAAAWNAEHAPQHALRREQAPSSVPPWQGWHVPLPGFLFPAAVWPELEAEIHEVPMRRRHAAAQLD